MPAIDRRRGIDDEDVDGPAQLLEPAFRLEGVGLGRDNGVIRADDVAQGNFRLGDGFEEVERAAVVSDQGGFVGEAVMLERIGERAFRRGRLERPGLHIHHRGVGIDAGDAVGPGRGVAIGVETAAADTLGRQSSDASAAELGGRSVHELVALCEQLEGQLSEARG